MAFKIIKDKEPKVKVIVANSIYPIQEQIDLAMKEGRGIKLTKQNNEQN